MGMRILLAGTHRCGSTWVANVLGPSPAVPHVVIKSVNSAFTLEWIARRYQPRIVILRRNPLNVVSSWLVLNIEGEPDLPARRLVRERWLEPLGVPPRPAHSKVASTAWDVGVLMCALRASAARHPEWMVVSQD